MRLFLSSQDFGNYANVAAQMAGPNKKAIFIKNAQDNEPPEVRNFSNSEKQKMFEEQLEEKIMQAGSFWSSGGNTFILRRAMKSSGLDGVLKKLLAEDKILYGGWSAGACIAASDLHGVEFGDFPQPDIVPKEYPIKETIWNGLNLVQFMVVPHCNSDWFGKEAQMCIKYLTEHDLPYQALEDGQVFVVDGEKQELLK
jgi:dipeptidase E